MAFKVAILVVSDTCAQGYEIARAGDKTGPALAASASAVGETCVEYVSDDLDKIQRKVLELASSNDLVLTAGGTGFGVRDVTPEAVSPILEKHASGIVVAMLVSSLKITPYSALARPVAGTIGDSLVITLPGSPKGAVENFEAVKSVISHAVHLNKGGNSRQLHSKSNPSESGYIGNPTASLVVSQTANDNGSEGQSLGNADHHSHHHHHHHHHHHTEGSHGHSHEHVHSHDHGHSGPKFYGPAHRNRTSPFPMIAFEDAMKTVLDLTPSSQRSVTIPIEDALGYVISEDVHAPLNVPPFRASIVDGYAVLHSDCPGVLPVSRVSIAASPLATFEAKTCVRITTGAPVPHGATAVVPVENTVLVEQRDGEELLIRFEAEGVSSGDNIREIGSDVSLGSLLLRQGIKLSPLGGEIGLLASIGVPEVSVYSKPKVGVLSTGDEVIPVTSACYGSHVWDSNRPMLLSNLRHFLGQEHVIDLGIVRDTVTDIEEALTRALSKVDILITTGGVSMGELDLLKPCLERLGGTIHFGRVAMKPGKPVTFATIGEKLVFALPGNPVSAVVCMSLFVLPALRKWYGDDPNHKKTSVLLTKSIDLDSRPEFHRVKLDRGENGNLYATSTGFQRSSRIQSMVRANALLCLPPATKEQSTIPAGSTLDAILLE